ncbi:hypothetical protein F4821DRAFT_259773 [Hypoxylon rubiginosum]|uniref:Uncharacterized protein n=1 Tax=Hypoxylon rubiginosum TaxID=110542 RepID=A0ACC0D1F5_9PEZI|nr:hypothetical protein F4821DRAFT_259773 [Hypoxylon rubiginosum]
MTQQISPDATAKAQPWMKWFTPGKVPATVHRAIEVYSDGENGGGYIGTPATEFDHVTI